MLHVSPLFWGVLLDIEKVEPDNAVVKNIFNFNVTDATANYLDVTLDGKTAVGSFLPASRVSKVSEADRLYSNLRQTSKLGNLVKKILIQEPSENELRHFIEIFSSKLSEANCEIKIFSGEELIPYYYAANYADGEGSELWKSCMRYESCQDYMQFYAQNPRIKLLVALNKDQKVAARAVLWEDVKLLDSQANPETIKMVGKKPLVLLDRIYAVSPQAKNILWSWGIKNVDVLHAQPKNSKKFLVASTRTIINPLYMVQEIEKPLFYHYPWVDTLKHLSVKDKKLSNYPYVAPDAVKLCSVSGDFERSHNESPRIADIRQEVLLARKDGTTK